MYIRQAIYNELISDSGVSALVGTRIYQAGDVPQDVSQPYIVIQKISDIPTNAHDGYCSLRESRFQITAFDQSILEVEAVNAAVFTCLNGFIGVMGGSGGVTVGRCLSDGDVDMYDSDYDIHYCPHDFLIAYNE